MQKPTRAPFGRSFSSAVFLILCVNGCTPVPGRMAFEPAEIDVSDGDEPSQEQEVTVTLRNVGGAALDIAEVKPSCGCIVIRAIESTHLEKGAGSAIKLGVSPPVFGKSDVMVVVQASSREVPPAVLSLHLSGSLQVPQLATATRSADMAGTAPHEELIGVVELLTDEPATATAWVTGLESSTPEVAIELIERKPDPRISGEVIRFSYVFAVRGVTPERGTRVSNLTLQTSAPPAGKNKRLPSIQVTRQYAPIVRAVPGELIAHRRGANPRVACRLAIVADDEVPFELTCDGDAEWFSVSAAAESSGSPEQRHILLIEIDTEKYSKLADGGATPTLVLSTTHPKCKELRVPVRVLVE